MQDPFFKWKCGSNGYKVKIERKYYDKNVIGDSPRGENDNNGTNTKSS